MTRKSRLGRWVTVEFRKCKYSYLYVDTRLNRKAERS